MMKGRVTVLGGLARCGIVASALLAGAANANADPIAITLEDANSSASVCVSSGCDPIGMNSWIVDGVDRLNQQWFWYRVELTDTIGPTGPAYGIDSLSEPVTTGSTGGPGTGGPTGSVAYSNGSIAAKVEYALEGGDPDSFKSTMTEKVTITNFTNQHLFVNFFQYSDFDLCGTSSLDSVHIEGDVATQTSTCDGVVARTVVNSPSHYEAGEASDTLVSIQGGSNLNDNASVSSVDATSAFQWHYYLLPYGGVWPLSGAPGNAVTFTITKSLAPVPEPMSMLLLGTGLLGVGRIAARQRRRPSVTQSM